MTHSFLNAHIVADLPVMWPCAQRIGTSMFIPLDSIQTKPINERLRTLGPRYRLCIDTITCEPDIMPAVNYAVSNTVVCDSLDAARQVTQHDCRPRGGARHAAPMFQKRLLTPSLCSGPRELCFQRNENVKAVTLSGAMISKAGTMTGGNTAKDKDQASRWDNREFADLKQKRDTLERELAELNQAHRVASRQVRDHHVCIPFSPQNSARDPCF